MSFPFYAIFPTQISKKYSIVLCYVHPNLGWPGHCWTGICCCILIFACVSICVSSSYCSKFSPEVGEILGEAWDLGMVGTYAQVHIVVNCHYHHGHFDWIILIQGYTFPKILRQSWATVLSSADLSWWRLTMRKINSLNSILQHSPLTRWWQWLISEADMPVYSRVWIVQGQI